MRDLVDIVYNEQLNICDSLKARKLHQLQQTMCDINDWTVALQKTVYSCEQFRQSRDITEFTQALEDCKTMERQFDTFTDPICSTDKVEFECPDDRDITPIEEMFGCVQTSDNDPSEQVVNATESKFRVEGANVIYTIQRAPGSMAWIVDDGK